MLLALLLVAITAAWTRTRTRHFIGHHDWDTVTWVSVAENYQRYGLIETRLQQISTPFRTDKEHWTTYQTHPPGISIITYFGIELFGNTEFTARIPPILASLVAAALLYLLARQIYGTETAILGLFFFGFTPVMIYFSGKIGHEQFTLPLMLAGLILYRRQKTPHTTLLLISIVGGFIGWMWYLFAGLLGLYTLRRYKWGGVRQTWSIWTGTAVAGFGIIALYLWQNPDHFQELWDAATLRVANTNNEPITLSKWILMIGSRLLWLPTPVVTLFAILALIQIQRGKLNVSTEHNLLFIPALVTIIYGAVFWQATYIHNYYLYFLFAPLSIWGAVGFWYLRHVHGRPPKPIWRLVFSILLIAFLVGSYRWADALFTTDLGEQRYTWGISAAKATQPGEVIVSNLPKYGPHVGYYARRSVSYEIEVDQVISSTRPASWGFYIYCVKEDDPIPQWLNDYSYEFDDIGICYLIDLIPD